MIYPFTAQAAGEESEDEGRIKSLKFVLFFSDKRVRW